MPSTYINNPPSNNNEEPYYQEIMVLKKNIKNMIIKEAMEVTECDGIRRSTEHLISLLAMRTRNGVLRVAKASVYKLDTTLRELTTAQAYLLIMFDALLAQDLNTCSLLLDLADSIEQLRSPYLEVWLREDFNFEKEEVRKVIVALDRMELNVPGHILRIFAGLTVKYCKNPLDILKNGEKNGYIVDEPEEIPKLEYPSQDLPVAKRCLGLPPNTSVLDVKIQACKTDIEGYALLHRFAEAGHTQGVQELLSIDVPCDLRGPGGSLPVHYAAEYGQLQVLPLLLRAGCNISAAREDGNTPVHLAASMGNVETLGWLAEHGANITAKNAKGQTPLHIAAAAGHGVVLNTLLNLMAEQRRKEGTRLGAIPRGLGAVDPRDSDGCTPLHLAARANNLDAVQVLLDRGADFTIINDEGLSPLNEAMLWGATEAEQLLHDIRAFEKAKRS